MGDWRRKKYISAYDLWEAIELFQEGFDLLEDDKLAQSSEAYKMLMLGRREMVRVFTDLFLDKEISLEKIAENFGLEEKNYELEKSDVSNTHQLSLLGNVVFSNCLFEEIKDDDIRRTNVCRMGKPNQRI